MAKDKAGLFLHYWRILASDMPEPEPEYPFSKVLKRNHRFDWAWPEYRIAVEIDGGNHMIRTSTKTGKPVVVGSHTRDSDYEKLNIAARLRWVVFRFKPGMLERDPQKCIDLVKQALKDSE